MDGKSEKLVFDEWTFEIAFELFNNKFIKMINSRRGGLLLQKVVYGIK